MNILESSTTVGKVIASFMTATGSAHADDSADLAKKLSNPVAALALTSVTSRGVAH